MSSRLARLTALAGFVALTTACAGPTATGGGSAPQPTTTTRRPTTTAKVDPAQAERLQRIMVPLLQVMDHPLKPSEVKVGIMDDPSINAASAGNGEFLVTTGLLQKANDDQLRAVLAHELAHQDLNHVTKAQTLGVGLNIGAIILDQIIPGSGAITPIAGELISRKYSRTEEYAADKHGVDILRRAGYSKQMMIDTLTWLMQTSGGSSGGFLATHPGTGERIQALKALPGP
ncbi:MAG TPA: M48 family metallopeptidase [Methylomirabilota bacterium]|jgi:Zn-dependent protease with chaperone function|nr:M48 family metallopeptidase [Methylomirabilota bacterium]